MSSTSEMLFSYLRDVIYSTPKAELDVDNLEKDYIMLGRGLVFFAQCFEQYNSFAEALSRGDLGVVPPPPENELAAPLKSLQASLRHLTWQSQQVAKGDYKQRVDFMGEFADAFNTMVEQLDDRQKKLEREIEKNLKRAESLEQNNQFLSDIMQHIPQQIIVFSKKEQEILLMNEHAKQEVGNDPSYYERILSAVHDNNEAGSGYDIEVSYGQDGKERYFLVNSYNIEWDTVNAEALVIKDISAERKQLKELEAHAYRDSMTGLFNRFYGMLTLNEWVVGKRNFSLIFVDMDNLKYVNDKFGHTEGDRYITSVASNLSVFSEAAIVCRVGGDEFMLLVPDINAPEADDRMNEVQNAIQNDEYLQGKSFYYSISFGIVAVDKSNEMPPSGILSIADERMYEHKRARKKERQ